jgi:putative ABC transport system permease protein
LSSPSLPARNLASRRAPAPHTSMFLRMLLRAAWLRPGRALAALLAMTVAAAASTAILNLYVDVQAKLREQFRAYGANLVVIGNDGAVLPADALRTIETTLGGRGLAVPFAYAVARTPAGQSVVVSGTDFRQARTLDKWWSVAAWPSAPGEVLVGARAQAVLPSSGKPFALSFGGHTKRLNPVGTLDTGAAEDSRVYLSLTDFEAWTGVEPSTIEIAASGPAVEVDAVIEKLARALPGAEVRPVRQVMEGEARVLGKTRATLLSASVLIILTAALCVLATLMGWVFDRRRDFAIMKALGASERLVDGFFAAEAALLGAAGALFGYAIGVGAAAWIGSANFHAAVTPRWSVLPVILAGSVAVALLSAMVPISLLRRVQPAMILRGE